MKFGCRTMKTKEIPEPKNVKDYILKPNMMIHLEVERAQAKEMKTILYHHHLFNKKDSKRPGGYNFRVLPDKSQLRTGLRGERDKINMLRKHQANVQLLSVFKSFDLQEMDSVQTIQGKTYTLRQALLKLDIPFPIFSYDDTSPKLFFSVDYASMGRDKTDGVIYLTAYHDQKHLAERVTEILPAYLCKKYGQALAKIWCYLSAQEIINEIKFAEDKEGNDTGEWSTTEDEHVQDMVDKDMGVELDFSGMEMPTFHDVVYNNADDASVRSFRLVFGFKQPPINDQQDPAVPGACLATVAHMEGAMSGTGAV
jgi:hypothetical protein